MMNEAMMNTINLTNILDNYGFGSVVAVMPTVTKAEDVDPIYAPKEPTFRRHTKAEERHLGYYAEKRKKAAKQLKKAKSLKKKYGEDFLITYFGDTDIERLSAIRKDSIGARRREMAFREAMAEYRRKGVR